MTATSSFASSVRYHLEGLTMLRCSPLHLAVSNANDALEKVRLIALTDPSILEPAEQLNVTVLADKDSGRIVIRGAYSLGTIDPFSCLSSRASQTLALACRRNSSQPTSAPSLAPAHPSSLRTSRRATAATSLDR